MTIKTFIIDIYKGKKASIINHFQKSCFKMIYNGSVKLLIINVFKSDLFKYIYSKLSDFCKI